MLSTSSQTPLEVLPPLAVVLMAAFLLAMVAVGVATLGHLALEALNVGTIRCVDADLIMLRVAQSCFALGVGCLLVLLGWGAVAMIQTVT